MTETRTCLTCGRGFVAAHPRAHAHTCSPLCSHELVRARRRERRNRPIDVRDCADCGVEIEVYVWHPHKRLCLTCRARYASHRSFGRVSTGDRLELIQDGFDRGLTPKQVAADLGIKLPSLIRWCRRAGHDDMLERLSRRGASLS